MPETGHLRRADELAGVRGIRRAYESIIDISGFGNGRNQKTLHQSGGEGYVVCKSAVYPYGGNRRRRDRSFAKMNARPVKMWDPEAKH